jgi:hypothetical protein
VLEVQPPVSPPPPRNPPRLSVFAHNTLQLRVIDWQRSRGRTVWKFRDRTYRREGRSSSRSTTPSTIDWTRLSAEGAWRVATLAFSLSCGLSKREVAAQVGETPTWVTKQLDLLADELERQNK